MIADPVGDPNPRGTSDALAAGPGERHAVLLLHGDRECPEQWKAPAALAGAG
jgi:hypothetical protein